MKITFIGATHEVTGSCYYLKQRGKKFLVDCGMEQGPDYYENQDIPCKAGSDLDFVLRPMHIWITRKSSRHLRKRISGTDLCNTGHLSPLRYYASRQCPHSDVRGRVAKP